MKVIIFGATGMVGQGVLRESLLAEDVTEVLVIGRSSSPVRHPKLREVIHADFADLSTIEDQLAGYDACFFCLGVSSAGLSEADYTRVSYDYTLAAARPLARLNPQMTFIYVSGAGTDAEGRAMWSRVKGRAENAVLNLFPNGYAFRPGIIQPTFGATSKTRWYRIAYLIATPIFPVLHRFAPRLIITTDSLGRAMLRVARDGAPKRVLENADLR
jgi:uncharacterized protein YbjT (DUF2867 family)